MALPFFIRNLIPRKHAPADSRPLLHVLAELTWVQWAHFLIGWFAWTCDAIDFFSVSLTVPLLDKQFNQSTHAVTTAITLTLLFRTVGAIVFGVLSDRFGRKWPLVANLLLVSLLELGAGFVETFPHFLVLRSVFGIGMGGIWGLAASTALENLPVEARGFASGVLQQGYAAGYLIAAVINLKLVPVALPDGFAGNPGGAQGWRALFWVASAISFLGSVLRAMLPESEVFLRARAAEQAAIAGGYGATRKTTGEKTRIFLHEAKEMLKKHWVLCIYAMLLMTGFNFLSHGSQDLYPTYLQATKGFTPYKATVATIIGNCGAISGGVIAGMLSQHLGRRLTIVLFVFLVGAFVPLWILPYSFSGIAAGAFCLQFGVQGAWGVIPIQLAEMSPPAFRATFPGVVYQLGNMISSASAQIEATGGDNLKTTIVKNGKVEVVPDYAKVQGIFIGVVAAFVVCITIVGPENHGSHFEQHKIAAEEGAADDESVIGVGVGGTAGIIGEDEESGMSPERKSGSEKGL